MATELADYRFKPGNVKYPWRTYMNGKRWELKRGVDFDEDTKVRSVRSAAHMYASRNGFHISTAIPDDDTFVIRSLTDNAGDDGWDGIEQPWWARERTVKELREIAKAVGIKGYWSMRRMQLIEAMKAKGIDFS